MNKENSLILFDNKKIRQKCFKIEMIVLNSR